MKNYAAIEYMNRMWKDMNRLERKIDRLKDQTGTDEQIDLAAAKEYHSELCNEYDAIRNFAMVTGVLGNDEISAIEDN